MSYQFPTPLHLIANKFYNHYPESTREIVNSILKNINEYRAATLQNIYYHETRFTRPQKLRNKWDEWYPEAEDQLTSNKENILIFLLNMNGCEIAKKNRKEKLRKLKS